MGALGVLRGHQRFDFPKSGGQSTVHRPADSKVSCSWHYWKRPLWGGIERINSVPTALAPERESPWVQVTVRRIADGS